MVRAAVLIGVGKTGNLPPLPGVAGTVRWMADWLKSQEVPESRISMVTDEAGPVSLQMVKDAVNTQLQDDVEQMIVYFSGHGVNLRYSEYWLLSAAPRDTQAAVNLDGSVALARQCGVPHVVFISDACRTAPEGLQAQAVSGGEIFPNDLDGEQSEVPVDVFFACALGKPALEIRDSAVSSKSYSSAFTKELIAALKGEKPNVLEQANENGQRVGIVRPRPLGNYLRGELPKVLQASQVANYTQLPYARITSDGDAWLSKVPLTGDAARRQRGPSGPSVLPPRTLDSTVQKMLNQTLQSKKPAAPSPMLDSIVESSTEAFAGADLLFENTTRNSEIFGPDHFETRCGFKVRGATIAEVFSVDMPVHVLDPERTIIRAEPLRGFGQVMIQLQDGSSVLVPAIPEFVCALTFEDNELADVTYELSENSVFWPEYVATMEDRRALRSIIASSARLGVFRLEQANAEKAATRIRYQKGYDPSMAIFAAYAFTDLRMQKDLQAMYATMRDDMGVRIFDVTMLARQLKDEKPGWTGQPIPAGRFPLLAQGWALLPVYGVDVSGLLLELQRHLKPSLWTYFDQQGSELLRAGLAQGYLR